MTNFPQPAEGPDTKTETETMQAHRASTSAPSRGDIDHASGCVENGGSRNLQQELDFSSKPTPPRPGEVEELIAFLNNNPGFHKAKDIGEFMSLSDRKIRQLAEAADGLIVSGPGSPGYCHLHHCEDEMTGHITDTLISQGKNMIRRGLRIKRLAREQAIQRIH